MKNDSNEILFEYIKNTIYQKHCEALNPSDFPEEYQKLVAGIVQLCQWVQDTKHFSEEIAKGHLDAEPPDVENVIAANLKALQGTLLHLTWQTEQIAKGDYNQKVEYMGMFSTAFNQMTEQLKDRTEALANEMHYVSEQNESMRRNSEMFQIFTQKSQEYIFITSVKKGEILYCNDIMKELLDTMEQKESPSHLQIKDIISRCPCNELNLNAQWEYKTAEGDYYAIQSVYIQWDGQEALAHSFMDVTTERKHEEMIEALIFKDALTGYYNRRYGMELLEKLQQEHKIFSLGFVDIDFLKYCNDEFGHKQGDSYIRNVADSLMTIPVEKTVCRVGGDEFMVIMENVERVQAEQYLCMIRNKLMQEKIENGKLPRCFSYGVVDTSDIKKMDMTELLSLADRRMYKFKIAAKESMRKGSVPELNGYTDNRVKH